MFFRRMEGHKNAEKKNINRSKTDRYDSWWQYCKWYVRGPWNMIRDLNNPRGRFQVFLCIIRGDQRADEGVALDGGEALSQITFTQYRRRPNGSGQYSKRVPAFRGIYAAKCQVASRT